MRYNRFLLDRAGRSYAKVCCKEKGDLQKGEIQVHERGEFRHQLYQAGG